MEPIYWNFIKSLIIFILDIKLLIIFILGIITGSLLGYGHAYGYKKWGIYLDNKVLSARRKNFITRLETLDEFDIIFKELNIIRKLESKLGVDHYDFSKEIAIYEETSKLVKDRGYI